MSDGTEQNRSGTPAAGDRTIPTGATSATLKQEVLNNLYYIQGRTEELATFNDWYMALAYTILAGPAEAG